MYPDYAMRQRAKHQRSHHRQALRAITIVAIAIIAVAILTHKSAPQCLDQGQLINCSILTGSK